MAAEQSGSSPDLGGAVESSGSVIGKTLDARSVVVSSTATRSIYHGRDILGEVFVHSIAVVCGVGLFVGLQANVWPVNQMVVH